MTNPSQAKVAQSPRAGGWRTLGPGLLVTAAFIGPGTVTKATAAGAQYGYALLWAVVFSVFAAMVFQEMSARLGIVTRGGLGEALRETFQSTWVRVASITLVVGAIGLGNAAYQAGNIVGASTGINALTGGEKTSAHWWSLSIGIAAVVVLWIGRYRILQKILVAMVVLMSCVFVLTALIVRPDVGQITGSLIKPTMPPGSLADVIALVGTTVVPYNLFLHASSAAKQWGQTSCVRSALGQSRMDTVIAITLGGLVTCTIMVTANAAFFLPGHDFVSLGAAAKQLEPTLGPAAGAFFCLGLFAAGLTSAITAPLAAAYATAGCLGWPAELRDARFRGVFTLIVAVGTACAVLAGRSPIAAIHFAQFANGLLLPLVAVYLLVVMNSTRRLGTYRNGWRANLLGVTVVLFVVGLGVRNLVNVVLSHWATPLWSEMSSPINCFTVTYVV